MLPIDKPSPTATAYCSDAHIERSSPMVTVSSGQLSAFKSDHSMKDGTNGNKLPTPGNVRLFIGVIA